MRDTYGREITYMRLSITDRCNLRCLYCMPEDGICKKPMADILTEEEMIDAVRAGAALGVKKLRITGGEPLVKRNVLSICERAAAVEGIEEVCMTTNGTLLPQFAKELKEAGVSRLNISLDTLNPEKFSRITRIGSLDDALKGLDTAFEVGFDKVKINAVLIGGFNDDEIGDLVNMTVDRPLDVRFIELMPMYDSGDFDARSFISNKKVLETVPELEPVPGKRHGEVADLYQLPGAQGRVGLISPVSSHFCGSCNRIRLTADGKLKPCLHSPDEYSIKGMDYESMKAEMERAIMGKQRWHGELSSEDRSNAGRNMNEIGG